MTCYRAYRPCSLLATNLQWVSLVKHPFLRLESRRTLRIRQMTHACKTKPCTWSTATANSHHTSKSNIRICAIRCYLISACTATKGGSWITEPTASSDSKTQLAVRGPRKP
jgi:hypothetical protein